MTERWFRLLFWVALVGCFLFAVVPTPPVPVQTSDKLQHMAAFATLTVLAMLGYRRLPWFALLAGLAAFGLLIELVQALPIVARDSDLVDWGADLLAISIILLLARAVRRLSGDGSAGT